MSLWRKEKIEIVTPMECNRHVQSFAKEYATLGTPIEVEVQGSLWKSNGNNLVIVKFTTNRTRDDIAEAFMEEFWMRNPRVGKRLMFCH